ncbi:MAG: hypothetical protein HZA04_08125 [Nitrospinae bacterium]|nr:hypothetical protein [Nitrospinota bacterium]
MQIPASAAQAALPLALPEKTRYSLDRFITSPRTQVALDAARRFVKGDFGVLVLTGKHGTGKTHLLKGIYHGAGKNCVFLSAAALVKLDHGTRGRVLSDAGRARTVCLDDLDQMEADDGFYQRIYTLFNALTASGGRLAVAMRASPAKATQLPAYLTSRLLTGMVAPLQRPDGEEQKAILQKLAADRAITLTPRAAAFILARSHRSVGELAALIGRLEHALPAGAKRIGLQLIRQVIHLNRP